MTFNEAKLELKTKYRDKHITCKEYMFQLARIVKQRNLVLANSAKSNTIYPPNQIFDGKLDI